MKYATWIIKRPEGSTPEPTIREAGATASGGFIINIDTVVGYLSDDATTTGLSEWDLTVITQQEALTLAQALNPESYLANDGTIQAPPPDIN